MAPTGRLQGLTWLADEVDATLKLACEALESFLADPTDTASIRQCVDYIHQIKGSLKVADCYGPLLLAEEMEVLADRILERRITAVADGCDVLVQAMLKLPNYLRQVMATRRDNPESLLLLLNEFRAVRGEPLISETSFFSPHIEASRRLSKPYDRQPDPVVMANLLRKLRQMYQYALLGLLKGEKIEENFSYLDKVFSRLKELSKGMPREPLWNVVLALLEGIAGRDIPLGYALKMLLRELEGEIRRLAQAGYDGLTQPLPEVLFKNLLFYIAFARSKGPRAIAVREDYRLDQSLPSDVTIEDTEDGLSPVYAPDAARLIVSALDQDIEQFKECLSRLVEESDTRPALLDESGDRLRKLVDAVTMLGRPRQRELLEEALAQLQLFIADPSVDSPHPAAVANCLVEAQTGLHGWLELNKQLIEGGAAGQEMQVEVNRAQAALLAEARHTLDQVKEIIVDFIASQWRRDKLDGLSQLVVEVRGALLMLELPRAVAVLDACNRFLDEQVLSARSVPNWNMLDALAEAITGIEYYLEVLDQQDRAAEQSILDLAEQSIARLGYSLDAERGTHHDADVEPLTEHPPSGASQDDEQSEAVDTDAIDREIIDVFLEEVTEVLATLDDTYQQWVDSPNAEQPVIEMRRAFHTLKGGGRMVGADQVAGIAWAVEHLLNRLIEKRVAITPTLMAVVGLTKDVLPDLAEAFSEQTDYSRPEYVAQLVIAAEALARGEETALPDSVDDCHDSDAKEPSPAMVSDNAVAGAEPDVGGDHPLVPNAKDLELLEIFAEEAVDYLDVIKQFVLEQRQHAPVYSPPTSALQSALHTLKGSARMAGVEPIGDLIAPLEHFIKELYNYHLEVTGDIVDLLDDGASYCTLSLSSVHDVQRVESIPELPVFLERLTALRDQIMSAILNDETRPSLKVDPDFLNLLMTDGMQRLLDADQHLRQWRDQPDDFSLLTGLQDELEGLAPAAGRAGMPGMQELAAALSQFYRRLVEMRRSPSDALLDTAAEGHELLLAMVDAVAANQDLPNPQNALLQRLESLSRPAEAEAYVPGQPSPESEPEPEPEPEPEVDSAPPAVVSVESDVAESRDLPVLEIVPLDREKIDLDILEIFIEEANELLEDIDRCLQDWQQDWQSREAVESLKRSLHTLKGGARMAGLQQLGELSHDFETDIHAVEHQRDRLDEAVFSRWLHKQDQLQSALVAARALLGNDSEGAPQAEPVVELAEKTVAVGESPEINQIPAQLRASLTEIPGITPPQRPTATSTEMVKVSAPLLESLVNLAGETSISRGRVEREISDFSVTLDEMGSTITRLRDQVRRIGVETEAHMMVRQEQMEAMQPPEGFDSLEMDRYSQLQQLSQALLESAYDIQDLKETLADKARSAEGQLLIQSRINTDLQERLMRTRMVPFSRIVPRLRRMVRQVSDEVGKKVELQLINIDGEMDRSVMEQMLAPLEHMIRNSIDHGIESAADRLAAGKPETGVISVGLAREAGDILLLLSDDGRGLNVEAIRHRAIEQGLIPEDSPLGDQDVIEFIFQPGFSTSNKVTQVSGRGVGMDVVNSQVRELGGSVQVVTDPGKGTRFIVRLPFTVSVNRALMIEMGNDLYALSLSSVDGVVRVSPVELEYYYLYPEARLEYAGEYYEVLYLDSLLHHRSTPKLDMESQSVFLILVHTETRHFAIQVDGLAGSMEIVVKSLGIQLSKVPGLTGATVMGDGRVVVILDLLALLRSRLMTTSVADREEIGEPETSSPVATVMVVDDSVTVRKVTSRFLLREGFSVITARDGLEAMTLLQEHRPDLMLLDIEMPRMDGFEVARRVKGSSELKQIPIIMITSRSGKKHRDRAFSLGVEHYMGKPYQEQELLKAMANLMPVATESGE